MNQIIAKLKILKEWALQNVRLLLGRSIRQCTGLNVNLQNLYVEIWKLDQILVEDGGNLVMRVEPSDISNLITKDPSILSLLIQHDHREQKPQSLLLNWNTTAYPPHNLGMSKLGELKVYKHTYDDLNKLKHIPTH